jgi:P-type Cu+ transporter
MAETTLDLPVLGMTCAACVRRVEQAALAVPGVLRAEVNLPLSRARIAIDPEVVSAGGAAAAIRAAGYEVPADALDGAPSGGDRMAVIERAHAEETAGLRRDAAIAIAATAPLLAIAMSHGALVPAASLPSVIAQLALGTLVVLGPGMRYLRAGLRAARHRAPDMNTLISLGAGAAWLSSAIAAIGWISGARRHAPELYFEAGAAIVAFVMIGKLLEARARSRLSEAVRGLVSLAPRVARRREAGGAGGGGGEVREVDAAALAPGDVIEVRPGERLAADGTVIEGRSAVDESMLTGEGLPIDKEEGAPVYAGTLNHHGALAVRVARAGGSTALARIARAVEEAQGSKPAIARLADRVAVYFVPAVLAIAALTLGAWLVAGAGAGAAVERMVAVLVIACPCALGLATPAAVAVGSARGAELGILYRSGAALELASAIDVVCLDKTGTLTAGRPALVGAELDAEALRLVAAAEQRSEHPIARAIVLGARARGAVLPAPAPDARGQAAEAASTSVSEFEAAPGAGISAIVDGHRVLAGTRAHLLLAGVEAPAEAADAYPGATVSHVAIDGAYAGVLAVADPAAPGARGAIAALRGLGIEPRMISGDREDAARAVAREVGIERVHAGVRPTEKAALVAAARAEGGGHRVAMVGDGINDAPALAAADLGVALGSGTEIAAAAADVTLLRGGIASLPAAFELARATLRTIRRNLVAAFAYNVLCIPIAAGALAPLTGWQLSPVLASAAMSLSSVSVLLSSLRLRRFRPAAPQLR